MNEESHLMYAGKKTFKVQLIITICWNGGFHTSSIYLVAFFIPSQTVTQKRITDLLITEIGWVLFTTTFYLTQTTCIESLFH